MNIPASLPHAVPEPGAHDFAAGIASALPATALPRWNRHAPRLHTLLHALYAGNGGFDAAMRRLSAGIADGIEARPSALRALDDARERDPDWFLSADMIGYSAYVDRFAGDLRGVGEKLPYLRELGIRYLHLLPFLRARDGDNDGGFAVRDYDDVEPALGTIEDLEDLAARLREAGISLCADFVLNHTADDHRWAAAAREGDARYRDYYLCFADRAQPDRYERDLREVFPLTAPGNFSEVPGLGWVWTTFYPYQWDLNWSNPEVFVDMALTLLRLANRGIEVFRLDSTAYLWKRAGTDCMNQPETHAILQALSAVCAIAAPGALLKAEAIVPARELPPYFGNRDDGGGECHLAYQSSLMAGAWAALARRDGRFVADLIAATPPLPPQCAWLNYVRCHDDIGWGVLGEEAAGHGFDLREISAFFAGESAGSFAHGRNFQCAGGGVHGSNGMSSALTGIAVALERDAAGQHDANALEFAERRLRLLYGVTFVAPGIPLIYMGDEYALGNDESYALDPERSGEGRWLQRPRMDWSAATRADAASTAGRIGAAIRRMIAARRDCPSLRADIPARTVGLENRHLCAIARGGDFVAVFNFGDDAAVLYDLGGLPGPTAETPWYSLLDETDIVMPLTVPPWGMRWLRRK